MAGSRFGRRYEKDKLTAPLMIDVAALEILAMAVGRNGAPVQAYRQLLARRAGGEDVVCLVDDRDLFVIDRAELPDTLR